MSDETDRFSEKLDEVIAECVQAEEAGEPVDRDTLLAAHPDLADNLREFFADRDQLRQLAGGMKGWSRQRAFVPPKVRYFGDYELLEEIARGGMGVVYKARQTSLNRIVAVKMILSGHLAEADDVKRFQSEAEAAASLTHPGIVAVHEVGLHDGRHYFSMDYIEGPSLAEMVRDHPLSARRAAGYVRAIAEAVHYAHGQGVLHRDLKPSNILLDAADHVHVTDFGLARRVEGDSKLTQTGQILGTPSYLAPEQAAGKRGLIGPASDVYSLGAILYELLTGRPPLQSDSPVETIRQVLDTEPVSPRLLNPAVPRDLETICLKCLQKEPYKRYPTAQHLADDLRCFLSGEPIAARPTSRRERCVKWSRRHPTATALIVVSGIALIALFGAGAGRYYNRKLESMNRDLDAVNRQLQSTARRLESNTRALEVSNEQLAGAYRELDAALKVADSERANTRRFLYVSQMTLVERAREEDQAGRVVQLLRSLIPEHPEQEDLRGFEWHHLWRLYHGEQSRLRGHSGAVTAVVFSPNDRILASGSADRTVKLWDLASESEIRTLRGHSDRVTSLAFSPSGEYVVSGSTDMTVMLWDTATGRHLRSFEGHSGAVTTVCFAPDGNYVASGSDDTMVRVWDIATGKTILEFDYHTCPVSGVAFSPDGKQIASTGQDGVITSGKGEAFIWHSETGDVQYRLIGQGQRSAEEVPWSCVSFSPDGVWVAAGGIARAAGRMNSFIQVWNVQTGEPLRDVEAHDHGIMSVMFSPDGNRLLSASADQSVKIWNVSDGRETMTLREEAPCLGAAFSPDGLRVASGSEDHTIKLWSPPGQGARVLPVPYGRANNVAFSPDGGRVAAVSGSKACVWDVLSGRELCRFDSPNLGRLAWSPSGHHIAIGGEVWDVATGRRIDAGDSVATGRLPGMGTAFSRDGKLLAATEDMTIVSLWDAATGKHLKRLQMEDGPNYWPCCVTFSQNDSQLVIGTGTDRFPLPGKLQVWDLDSGTVAMNLDGFRDSVASLALSPDGTQLAAGTGEIRGFISSNPGEIRIWDTTTWQEIWNLRGHRHCVYSVAYSPDGRRLVSAAGRPARSVRGEVKIWDLTTGQEIAELVREGPAVYGVAFSPCGRRIATATLDGNVRIYDGTIAFTE